MHLSNPPSSCGQRCRLPRPLPCCPPAALLPCFVAGTPRVARCGRATGCPSLWCEHEHGPTHPTHPGGPAASAGMAGPGVCCCAATRKLAGAVPYTRRVVRRGGVLVAGLVVSCSACGAAEADREGVPTGRSRESLCRFVPALPRLVRTQPFMVQAVCCVWLQGLWTQLGRLRAKRR